MNYNDIIALVHAGYTKEEISAMSAPQAQTQPAPAVIQPAPAQNWPVLSLPQGLPPVTQPAAMYMQPAAAPVTQPAAAPVIQPAPAPVIQPAAAPAVNPNLPPVVNPADPTQAMLNQILLAVQAGNAAALTGAAPAPYDEEPYLASLAGYEPIEQKG